MIKVPNIKVYKTIHIKAHINLTIAVCNDIGTPPNVFIDFRGPLLANMIVSPVQKEIINIMIITLLYKYKLQTHYIFLKEKIKIMKSIE